MKGFSGTAKRGPTLPGAIVLGWVFLTGAGSGFASDPASPWDQSKVTYAGPNEITVYRHPSCGCCGAWMTHLENQGFKVTEKAIADMDAVKDELGVPQSMGSCHTATIGGYIVEGHVPADDIKRLLNERPEVAGLAVPGMPQGSPGMETGKKDPFAVFSFDKTGQYEAFNEYWAY